MNSSIAKSNFQANTANLSKLISRKIMRKREQPKFSKHRTTEERKFNFFSFDSESISIALLIIKQSSFQENMIFLSANQKIPTKINSTLSYHLILSYYFK